jgi:4-hydroxyphenylpyruvate dioxygenase
VPTATRPDAVHPIALGGFAHIEFWVGNAYQAAQYFRALYGFRISGYQGPETGVRDRVSYVLDQNDARFILTSSLNANSEIARHVYEHGDGVKDIAFRVADAAEAYELVLANGALPKSPPVGYESDSGKTTIAAIGTYGEVVHSLVSTTDSLPPGYEPRSDRAARPIGLALIDHVVGNVELGQMERWVDYYEQVLGLQMFQQLDPEKFSSEYSAANSKVMWDGVGNIRLNINEAAPGKRQSQIEEYLVSYRGPGVQHIAFRTDDVVHDVAEVHSRGLETIRIPDEYYEGLPERTGLDGLDYESIQREKLLVDQDAHGYLVQTFTRVIQDRPTLFLEFIERKGALGFGEGNAKDLFRAIERDQEKRGNL